MRIQTGRPFKGALLKQLQDFLRICGLDYDPGIDFTAALMEDDEIIATGSLDGATLKCIAVSPMHQGEDLSARILTELRQEAFRRGEDHLMLFTKPGNRAMFAEFGFYPLVRTADCLLMENKRDGLDRFLAGLERPAAEAKRIGCIVANCNPFTLGHRYLVERAAEQVDALHLFILSERRGMFAPQARMDLVRQGCTDLKNVLIHPTGPYMVSSATFPSYFIRSKDRIGEIHCELDVRLFGERIAPALGITHRFVGSEPFSEVTNFYNQRMLRRLPEYGVEVIELPRRELNGTAISATQVRRLIESGQMEEIRPLVPETTYRYIHNMQKD